MNAQLGTRRNVIVKDIYEGPHGPVVTCIDVPPGKEGYILLGDSALSTAKIEQRAVLTLTYASTGNYWKFRALNSPEKTS